MTPSGRLRFGVVNEIVPDHGSWLDHVQRIEDCGADTLLIRDHLEPGGFGPQLAPLTAAAAAAAHTTRLRLGTMVLSNDYRHPALVAHEAATIDLISGGRFELGLGAGWLRAEYQQMGIPFEPAGARIARLEESIGLITALLSGETVTGKSAHYTVEELRLPVTPVQRPHPPLMIGGGGPRMLALAARHADIVGILPAPIRGDTDSDDPADRGPDALAAKLAVVASAAGERYGQLELSTFATFLVTSQRRRETEALIEQRGWSGISCEQVWEMPTVFIGSAEQIRDDLEQRRATFGLSYFVSSDRRLGHLEQVIAA
jgi:probable F420-dependent oxidoreductase